MSELQQGEQPRTYIVTGAAGGIGGATVKRLLATGANVLGVDISQRRLDTFAASCSNMPGRLATYRADLSIEDEVRAVIACCLDTFGDLTGIANVAGGMIGIEAASMDRPLADIGLDYFRRTFQVNVDSAFLMCKHAEPHFVAKGYGKICNVASLAAFANRPDLGDTAYNPAKAAVVALTQTLSLLLGRQGIRVNAVAPGLVFSPKVTETFGGAYVDRHLGYTALGHFATVEDEAEGIAFFLEPQSDAVTGEVLRVAAGTR
ncbi:SDR family NAD(P)-dependent oxidoreductase [Novosphingobium colocasiae]|uniref:Oxidoreductase n=1 Tax=Novosphingobium colocasiae TaxID=1256513 RepID=A0A918P8F6_9SPHN|nr:SDR family oxidoreductase [Novosphingobium colocasiae]GGY90565.1 oxidoreductase [Novosphingobium colocasiae]